MSEVHPFKVTIVTSLFSNLPQNSHQTPDLRDIKKYALYFLTALWNIDLVVVCRTENDMNWVKQIRPQRIKLYKTKNSKNKIAILHDVIQLNPFDTYWFAWLDITVLKNSYLQSFFIQMFKPELRISTITEDTVLWDSRMTFVLGKYPDLFRLPIEHTESFLFEESEPINLSDFMKPKITPLFITPVLTGDLGNKMFQVASTFAISQSVGMCAIILSHQTDKEKMFENFYHGKVSYTSSLTEYSTDYVNQHLYDIASNSIIYGNLNVPRYFDTQKHILQMLFAFKQIPVYKDTFFIQTSTSQFKLPGFNNFLQKALKHISEKMTNKTVKYRLFLENEMKYTEQFNFEVDTSNDPYEIISNMRACEHGGISFGFTSMSWWAVYLNPNPNSFLITNSIHPKFISDRVFVLS